MRLRRKRWVTRRLPGSSVASLVHTYFTTCIIALHFLNNPTFTCIYCAAQLSGSLLWVPMDVIKERLQIEGQLQTVKNYGSSWEATKGIFATEGVLGLYRAYWIHQMTWAPFNGLYFATYEASKNYINKSNNNSESQSIATNLVSISPCICIWSICVFVDLLCHLNIK